MRDDAVLRRALPLDRGLGPTLFGVLAVTDIMPPRFLVTNSDNNTKRRFSIPSMCSSRAAMLDILDRLVLTYKT